MIDKGEKIKILLVEDNPGDVRLVLRVLKKSKLNLEIVVMEDGEEALDYLFQKEKYKDVTQPNMILLDLNLPKISGFDILEISKKDSRTKHIPIAILTASESDSDVLKAYSKYANFFMQKPVNFEQLEKFIMLLDTFWFTLVKRPKGLKN